MINDITISKTGYQIYLYYVIGNRWKLIQIEDDVVRHTALLSCASELCLCQGLSYIYRLPVQCLTHIQLNWKRVKTSSSIKYTNKFILGFFKLCFLI